MMRKIRYWSLSAAVFGMLCSMSIAAAASESGENMQLQSDEENGTGTIGAGRTYYEIFVRSFYDSDGDGVGDLDGVTQKLSYIEELGFNGIWLMPIMTSPTYHKYDTADYREIDPEYGTIEQFQNLLSECEKHGIDVILDFPMNHTSAENEWFLQAVSYLETLEEGQEPDPEVCPYTEYYHFSAEKESDSWYQAGSSDWYYEGVFWSGMPDLNLDSEAVRAELADIAAYWLELGADGFRLDGAKEYFSGNKTKNMEVLSWFEQTIHAIDPEAYLVAEVWDSADLISAYAESGIGSMFDFPFGDRNGEIAVLVKQAGNGKAGKNFAKKLVKTTASYLEADEDYIDAPFLTNHDTDRLADIFSGNEDRMKFAAAMNLFMSGNAFVYYGEEIGMAGSGIDENKRAPMYWDSDLQAEGMTKGPENMQEQTNSFPSAADQMEDPGSIYSYYKKAIALRNRYPALAKGLTVNRSKLSEDGNLCVIEKTFEDERILCIYNFNKAETVCDLSLFDIEFQKTEALCTGADQNPVPDENGRIVIPAYGILILLL